MIRHVKPPSKSHPETDRNTHRYILDSSRPFRHTQLTDERGESLCNFEFRRTKLLSGRNGDLNIPRPHQCGDHYCGPGRPWNFEIVRVHGIHSLELGGVRQVHLHTYDIGRRHSRRSQNCADIFETLLHFGVEIAGDFSRGVLAALTRNVKCVTRQDSLTVIAARFGAWGQDDFLVGTGRGPPTKRVSNIMAKIGLYILASLL